MTTQPPPTAGEPDLRLVDKCVFVAEVKCKCFESVWRMTSTAQKRAYGYDLRWFEGCAERGHEHARTHFGLCDASSESHIEPFVASAENGEGSDSE